LTAGNPMHILFVVPGWPKGSFWDVIRFRFPPLAIPTLCALTPREHRISFVDESIAALDPELTPDLVAITAMTPLAPRAYEIADHYRARGVPVILGGIHVSNLPGEAAAHADAVVVGEADEIWADILADAAAGRLRPRYAQPAYTRMELLPPADRSHYPRGRYFFENIVQTTRGCPHKCEFCTVTAFLGGTYRTRPIPSVLAELDSLQRAPGYVFFGDDNIAAKPEHFQALLTQLSGRRLRWICQAPIAVASDQALLGRMARAGCHGIFIGLESLNQENLAVMGKHRSVAASYRESIRRIHDHGIGVYGSFIFGYDHDTPDVFDQFLDFANAVSLDGAFLPVLTPFPGTRIHQRLAGEGRILTSDWRRYDMATVVYRPAKMTVDELQEGFWKVNKGFYSLTSTLRRLFRPSSLLRRSNIIFMPMNFGHIPAVRKACRLSRRTPPVTDHAL
jgi:radical SAM superfamily enzyme YgiQ (UPF0313 family)